LSSGTATAINNKGQIVGNDFAGRSPSIAFIFSDGVLRNLNDLIYGNPGFLLSDAEGINDAGKIIVNGKVNFDDHAFLLIPHTPTIKPVPPTNITSSAGQTLIGLYWKPSSEALSYNIKRSNRSGGPYALVGVARSGPNFYDNTVKRYQTYFYVISGVNPLGEGGNSQQIQVTTH